MYAANKPPLKETYLKHIASTGKHDLIFFEKRSTPKVVSQGQPFQAPEAYGKQTKRRPATEAEEKTIARGDWVRVDQSGKKGGEDGYKKTKMKGREHLVHDSDVSAYLEHVGVRGMKWGHRKAAPVGTTRARRGVRTLKTALKNAAIGTFIVFGSSAVASAFIGRAPGVRSGPTRGQTRANVLKVTSQRLRPIAALTAGREAVERLRG